MRRDGDDLKMAESLAELPLVLTVQQVQEILWVSKTTAYELVHTGAIESVRVGRHFRVTRPALAKFLGLATNHGTPSKPRKEVPFEG